MTSPLEMYNLLCQMVKIGQKMANGQLLFQALILMQFTELVRVYIYAHKPYFIMPGHNNYINVMAYNHVINLVNTPAILPWPQPCM